MTNTYDILLNPPPHKQPKTEERKLDGSLLADPQGKKEAKQQSSQAENQQASKEASKQANQEENQQSSKLENQQVGKPENRQSSKPLKKFASYLAEDTFYELKELAIQLRKKDYEVLQEAVDAYVQKKKRR